jgi:predicted Zn-dependent peptidase
MRRLRIIKSDFLKASVLAGETPCGMRTFYWPMPGFTRYFAVLVVKYGSIDNKFVPLGGREPIKAPEGIAHFLEHKLFEDRRGDVGERFSVLGSSVNAMTTFDSTTYYFSCTGNFERSLRLLLNFVRKPDFGEAGVEKEKSIIGQEIMMERDNPDWRIFFNMLQAMYVNHPVRIDIAGTPESVAKINRGLLIECHRTFYHPRNMVMVVAGDFSPAKIAAVVESASGGGACVSANIRRIYPDEPLEPGKKSVADRMDVTRPKVLLGFKDRERDYSPEALFRRDIVTAIVLDVLFGRTSRLYNDLYSCGLIDGTFAASHSSYEKGFGYTAMGGDTDKPEALAGAVLGGLKRAARRGLNAREFRRKRKKAIGAFLGTFDSPDNSAMLFAHFHMRGANIFDYFKVMERVTLDDANERLRSHLNEDNCVVSRVLPLASKK